MVCIHITYSLVSDEDFGEAGIIYPTSLRLPLWLITFVSNSCCRGSRDSHAVPVLPIPRTNTLIGTIRRRFLGSLVMSWGVKMSVIGFDGYRDKDMVGKAASQRLQRKD